MAPARSGSRMARRRPATGLVISSRVSPVRGSTTIPRASPDATSAQQKDDFDTSFEPYYRIEQVILTDPRVHEAVVVRRPDQRWGEVPVVFVVRTNEDGTPTAEEIEQNCRDNLSSYKRPKAIFFIALCAAELSSYKRPREIHFITDEELPRSTTGKIQRHELEARLDA